jgi:hypothetical protein
MDDEFVDDESIPMEVCRGINSISSWGSCCCLIVSNYMIFIFHLWNKIWIRKTKKWKSFAFFQIFFILYKCYLSCVQIFLFYCTQFDSVDVNDYHCFCTKKKKNERKNMRIKENIWTLCVCFFAYRNDDQKIKRDLT